MPDEPTKCNNDYESFVKGQIIYQERDNGGNTYLPAILQ
jgi:hypothetical protein